MATTAKRVKDARKPKFSSRKHNRCQLCGRPRAFLRKFGREFAVVDGSWFYNDLERGEIDYRAYHLTKD